jgi:hypothetical protein
VKTLRNILAFLSLFLCFGAKKVPVSHSVRPPECNNSELKQYEAEILLYLLPQSEAVRRGGGKVAWQVETTANQRDFYSFYVYDLKGSAYGSPTIGHFAVNKHTAQVWNSVEDELVESDDLSTVERIIQTGHCITEDVFKAYSSIDSSGT